MSEHASMYLVWFDGCQEVPHGIRSGPLFLAQTRPNVQGRAGTETRCKPALLAQDSSE
jgi:hypothetical protein